MQALFLIIGLAVVLAVGISVGRGRRYAEWIGDYPEDEIDDEPAPPMLRPSFTSSLDTPHMLPGLTALGSEIGDINRANGWRTFDDPKHAWSMNPYYIPAVLMLLVSEAAEALEAYRKNDRENFNEEIADVLIRTLDLVDLLDIDIEPEVWAKMQKNRTRGYRHGGKRV